jgi:hypothetical protein
MGYLYQATDVSYIVRSPTISGELQNFHFIQGLQGEHLSRKVNDIIAILDRGKPILCVYNISNVHWVAFCILRKANGTILTLYKDSMGNSNTELMDLLKGKSAEFKFHPRAEQIGDGTSCGIFALENIRIMAREINGNRDNFIANFESHAFCTLDRARQLRQGDFPTYYTQGVQEYARIEAARAKKAQELRTAHQPEVDFIIARLQAGLTDGIKVQNAELKATDARTLQVEIGADSANLDTYHYRIKRTPDISQADLQNLLMGSQFAWYEGADYRIEDNIVKVTKKVTPT